MKAYLVFADGDILEGEAHGATGKSIGEVVFNTSMTGYQEILTDPTCYGQIVTMTYPLIGNYGVNAEDDESDKSYVRGLIVREICEIPSNFRCEGTLDDYLKSHGIICISGVDTRSITRKVRTCGVMNGAIVTGEFNKDELLAEINSYRVSLAVENVTCDKPYAAESGSRSIYNIGLYDFGVKKSVVNALTALGCKVTVLPASTAAEEAMSYNFDGFVLSNGPGDPADNTAVIADIGKLAESGAKIFGIGLGYQMLCLSQGLSTYRLPFGHRGGNHPVKNLKEGRTYMSSQNHGYAVAADSLSGKDAEVSFININDGSVEGVDFTKINASGVQFNPAGSDTAFLLSGFLDTLKK